MFVLHPDGDGVGGPVSSTDALKQKLWFFGKLGCYFVVIHGASLFVNSRKGDKVKN